MITITLVDGTVVKIDSAAAASPVAKSIPDDDPVISILMENGLNRRLAQQHKDKMADLINEGLHVEAIKHIRNVLRNGLKESKDIVEMMKG